MIAKKVLPLLFALAFLILLAPGRTAGAYSFPDEPMEITDSVKEKLWARIFTEAQNEEPYYLVCYLSDGLPYVFTFSAKPVFTGCTVENGEVFLHMQTPYRTYQSFGGQSTYAITSSYGVDLDPTSLSYGKWDIRRDYFSESLGYTRKFTLYNVPKPPKDKDGSYSIDSSYVADSVKRCGRFLFSNFSLQNFDGTTVFPRAPLDLNTNMTQKISLGAQETETEAGKVGTVTVMIAVSSVLLFPLLATFLKKSFHSLVK